MALQKPRSRLLVSLLAAVCGTFVYASTDRARAETADGATASKLSLPPAASGATLRGNSNDVLRNKKFEDSQLLTDPKLRAEEGSLSRYSFKGNLSYFGPPVGDLTASEQPNIDGIVRNTAQRISGSVMVRYRVDSNSAINFGTGVSAIRPLHGLDRFDSNNPFVSYSMSSKIGPFQMRNSPSLIIATMPVYTAIGEIGGISLDNDLVYTVGNSRLALSLDTNVAYWIFNRTYIAGPQRKGGDGLAQQYTISMAPGFRYRMTDAFNIFGSVGFGLYNPRQDSNPLTIWSSAATLRAGFGYAIYKDFFISPFLQSYVARAELETTSLNLSAIVSIL